MPARAQVASAGWGLPASTARATFPPAPMKRYAAAPMKHAAATSARVPGAVTVAALRVRVQRLALQDHVALQGIELAPDDPETVLQVEHDHRRVVRPRARFDETEAVRAQVAVLKLHECGGDPASPEFGPDAAQPAEKAARPAGVAELEAHDAAAVARRPERQPVHDAGACLDLDRVQARKHLAAEFQDDRDRFIARTVEPHKGRYARWRCRARLAFGRGSGGRQVHGRFPDGGHSGVGI